VQLRTTRHPNGDVLAGNETYIYDVQCIRVWQQISFLTEFILDDRPGFEITLRSAQLDKTDNNASYRRIFPDGSNTSTVAHPSPKTSPVSWLNLSGLLMDVTGIMVSQELENAEETQRTGCPQEREGASAMRVNTPGTRLEHPAHIWSG